MGKIIVTVLGLAIVLGVAYFYLTGGGSPFKVGKETPHQTLENVRKTAKGIEADAQKRADDRLKSSQDLGGSP